MYQIIHDLEGATKKKLIQDVKLGKNIQNIRIQKSMSQADVVVKLQLLGSHLSLGHYAHIEQDRNNINVSDLIYLQRIFEVDFSEFFKDLIP